MESFQVLQDEHEMVNIPFVEYSDTRLRRVSIMNMLRILSSYRRLGG